MSNRIVTLAQLKTYFKGLAETNKLLHNENHSSFCYGTPNVLKRFVTESKAQVLLLMEIPEADLGRETVSPKTQFDFALRVVQRVNASVPNDAAVNKCEHIALQLKSKMEHDALDWVKFMAEEVPFTVINQFSYIPFDQEIIYDHHAGVRIDVDVSAPSNYEYNPEDWHYGDTDNTI